jgi:hypothetical protein
MASTKNERKRRSGKAADAIDRIANDDQVSPFARQHGAYVKDGNRGVMNRGGTPVARWRSAGLLSEMQMSAIEFCVKLWEKAGTQRGLVQDLLKVVGNEPGSGMAQQEALDELQWFKDRIPHGYWQVFENVCRFDMPAGTAGSALANNNRSAIDAAQLCVRFVADLIATWKRM